MVPPLNKPLHVDFVSLRIRDVDFDELYKAKGGRIDFQDAETVTQLTKSILKVDFGVQVDLPLDRLCPPVPIRYEYIRLISALLASTGPDTLRDDLKPDRRIVGIDIGTGASVIYPLLATSQHASWRMHATELDTESFAFAQRNVRSNDLDDRISVHKISSTTANLVPSSIGKADFLMCNPPFFTSERDLHATSAKDRPPNAVCTGADCEMICPGGDLGFSLRILEESMRLTITIQWYTVMLGKLSSVSGLVAAIKARGIGNWIVHTLLVGSATRRWVVGWSHHDRRASSEVARALSSSNIDNVQPPVCEITIDALSKDIKTLVSGLRAVLDDLDVSVRFDSKIKRGVVMAERNVWNRAARRALKRDTANAGADDEIHSDDENKVFALGVRITVDDENGAIHLRWVKGIDAVLFESFVGMMRREMKKLAG